MLTNTRRTEVSRPPIVRLERSSLVVTSAFNRFREQFLHKCTPESKADHSRDEDTFLSLKRSKKGRGSLNIKFNSQAQAERGYVEDEDVGHDEDVHPNTLREADVDGADLHQDNYEDADVYPSRILEETPTEPHHETSLDTQRRKTGEPGVSAAAQCGERTSDGHCGLRATVGEVQKRCPDMFRCSEEVSSWLQENQNHKEQLEELRETTSELQEELRNHRHRVQILEIQKEENPRPNSTFNQRIHPVEMRHDEARTLLRVHAALLHELQADVRNLSSGVRHMTASMGCTAGRLLGRRDTLVPDRHFVSSCPSDCASLYLSGVRHSGVYTIVLSPGANMPADLR
ncbi:uncharacterized protein LOC133552155 [Nerophis ophidion]|uniref:uncharacterized protein LOC133552155 n=1 Tax=Nerophis ophidion TaxID=159077 RepID=UPI002ADF0586|nr:uncharacterized protein LOC133552155 [Nerophis ophidion]